MKTLGVLFTVVAAALASPASNPLGKEGDVLNKRQTTYTPGIDITAAGPLPAWSSINAKFVGIQTTSGTSVTNPYWSSQRSSAWAAGLRCGGIHLPVASLSTAVTQATTFTNNGGGYISNGVTFRGAVFLERIPTISDYCHSFTVSNWYSWINQFTTQYKRLNGRYPLIMTSKLWWTTCVGGDTSFAALGIPLWVVNYNGSPTTGGLPGGWTTWVFWQSIPYLPYNTDQFNGNAAALAAYAYSS